jgi:hypothetical protein
VTTIAGEQVSPGGFAFIESRDDLTVWGFSERKAGRRPQAILRSATIIWGTNASDTIIWGTNTDDTIIWTRQKNSWVSSGSGNLPSE